MDTISMKITHVDKAYKVYDNERERLKSLFTNNEPKTFQALNDVNFELHKGEVLGILGHNGAGKSTLLKLISGVSQPTNGEIEVKGRMASLLELGVGFDPNLTGIENIAFYAKINGFPKEYIEEKQQEIIDFADIGEFIYAPVKTYSSGMFARLAFATTLLFEPDILLVDEILSVGDSRFQLKSFKKMMEYKERGTTIILVSHSIDSIFNFCDKGLWLDHGHQKMFGDVREVVFQYEKFMEGQKMMSSIDHVNADENNLILHGWAFLTGFEMPNLEYGRMEIHAVEMESHEHVIFNVSNNERVDISNNIYINKYDYNYDYCGFNTEIAMSKLNPGTYLLETHFFDRNGEEIMCEDNTLKAFAGFSKNVSKNSNIKIYL
ncbi:MAG TPA: ABC transporter ATP-binding protein [Firmicutes bacterium]|nr:ABC transporter ATP-binding protein [Bacillota bacterium]